MSQNETNQFDLDLEETFHQRKVNEALKNLFFLIALNFILMLVFGGIIFVKVADLESVVHHTAHRHDPR